MLQVGEQLITLVPPLLGALLLGRWALWMCAAALLAIVGGAAWSDIARHFYDPVVVRSASLLASQFGAGVLAASLLFDRAAVLIGGYVSELAERNRQLARTRDRLQLEMREKDRVAEQLMHSQKMEVVGRLASGVAHDFNHLLGLVVGYASQGPELDDVEGLRTALAGAESAARRAAAVSRQLLDFSRREPPRLEVFDLDAALVRIQPMLRQMCPPGVGLELTCPARRRRCGWTARSSSWCCSTWPPTRCRRWATAAGCGSRWRRRCPARSTCWSATPGRA